MSLCHRNLIDLDGNLKVMGHFREAMCLIPSSSDADFLLSFSLAEETREA